MMCIIILMIRARCTGIVFLSMTRIRIMLMRMEKWHPGSNRLTGSGITSEAGAASIRIPTSTAITLIKTVSAGTAKISAWQSTQDTREEETARKSRSDRDHRPIRRRLLPEHAVWQPASMSMS